MISEQQRNKANHFLSLHKQDKLLVLPNIWNPIGARILEAKGFPAVATASAAVSSSLGYKDGEKIKFSTHLAVLERIANSVDVPVTADIEAGYSKDIDGLKENINRVIEAGVVGINFEDSIGKEGELRSINEQCERIAAVRETADRNKINLVINARVDCFLAKEGEIKDKLKDAVKRANEYLKAGADSIYPIGFLDLETVKTLRQEIKSPINILGSAKSVPLKTLQEIGINRVTFGPFVFRSVMKKFTNIVEELNKLGGYESFGEDSFSYVNLQNFLRDKEE